MVWYAAYGSNLSAERFNYYIEGGRPPGSQRAEPYPGCRDRSPPAETRPDVLPGEVFFAGRSKTWGDYGVAFLDPDVDGVVRSRLYLITAQQFEDVVAQENQNRLLDLGDLERLGRRDLGTGWYGLVLAFGRVKGRAVLTVTNREPKALFKPSLPYLGYVARGLREAHGMSDDEIADYVLARPGAAGAYTREQLLSGLASA